MKKQLLSSMLLVFALSILTVAQESKSPEAPKIKGVEASVLELKTLRRQIIEANKDEEKLKWNTQFNDRLLALLTKKEHFELDSISSFGIVPSRDKAFTFYTWNIALEDESYQYYNIIKFKNGEILELKDASENSVSPETQTYSSDNWFGALYYDIIPVKDKRKNKYYLLLGWDGHSALSTRKIIDVFFFNKTLKEWQFGKKVFYIPYEKQSRIIIEYSSDVTVTVKYHPKRNQVVFDHVVPPNPGLEGIYEFYVPDLSFDAIEFRKDKWYFVQNVDIRSEDSKKEYNQPELLIPPKK